MTEPDALSLSSFPVSPPPRVAASDEVAASLRPRVTASSLAAWLYLVRLSIQRQAQVRQMVWIAVGLLGLTATVVALITAAGRWGTDYQVACFQFSRAVVFEVLLGFLLPIWSLSFATQALGSERETRTLLWLLTRPLPRPAIYLAKFLSLLPWALGLTLGGFALICLLAGPPGRSALRLYWSAILWGTVAYCALFYLIGAVFRRPAVVALVYTFFLETFLGSMPGEMKRVSVNFYARCLMFDAAEAHGFRTPDVSAVYLPVNGTSALWVLLGATTVLLALGTFVFSRAEYHDLT